VKVGRIEPPTWHQAFLSAVLAILQYFRVDATDVKILLSPKTLPGLYHETVVVENRALGVNLDYSNFLVRHLAQRTRLFSNIGTVTSRYLLSTSFHNHHCAPRSPPQAMSTLSTQSSLERLRTGYSRINLSSMASGCLTKKLS